MPIICGGSKLYPKFKKEKTNKFQSCSNSWPQ